MNARHGIAAITLIFALSACSLFAPAPLDPVVGDTGQPLSPNAQSFDVQSYALDLEVFPAQQSISGSGSATVLALKNIDHIELKLDHRFAITSALVDNQASRFERHGGIVNIYLPHTLASSQRATVTLFYSGKPHIALRAPWSGGFVWSKTDTGQDWIATAVQGEGCDLWWPCKDHFGDKPEHVSMKITVPTALSVAMNGHLIAISDQGKGRRQFHWQMDVPASDYNIALNIGPFVRIEETYRSINGVDVPIEFWTLQQNEKKARDLIANDLRAQIEFFEKMLGPYPWGNEKMGFVETPHLGMEHQTINAYGKGYERDSNGFDWLLQHELSHEWFGNLMTHKTLNHAWLHEGFGQYMQPAYSRYRFGDAAYRAAMYNNYLRLQNCTEIVLDGTPTSEQAFNGDIYFKGGWTLHTLRFLIGEEAFWKATRELLYGTAETTSLRYPITSVYRTTDDFIALVNRYSGKDFNWLFDVYMREADLPELVVTQNDKEITLTWSVPHNKPFPMPVPLSINGRIQSVDMSNGHTTIAIQKGDHIIVDPNMDIFRYLPIIGKCEENQQKTAKRR